MNKKSGTVLYAQNLEEALYHLEANSEVRVYGSGTGSFSGRGTMLFTRNIEELKTLDRRERYIDIGSAVSLADIHFIGSRRLPAVFYEALQSISSPFIRNIATIGGNICMKRPGTLFAPLLALDAQLEFKTRRDIITLPVSKFSAVIEKSLLTKIRLPIDEWDAQFFYRLRPEHLLRETSAGFAFLATTPKNIISEIRIAFSGRSSFRCWELENHLSGMKLPLSPKLIAQAIETASQIYDRRTFGERASDMREEEKDGDVLRRQFLNLLADCLDQIGSL